MNIVTSNKIIAILIVAIMIITITTPIFAAMKMQGITGLFLKFFDLAKKLMDKFSEIFDFLTPEPPEEPVDPTDSITKTVTSADISSMDKVDLDGYFGGGTVNLTGFTDTNTASQITRSNKNVVYDPTNKWLTYKGKIAVAAASKRLKASEYRSDIYYFKLYDELYLKINGTWYEAIVIDVCGTAMNPNDQNGDYYNDGCSTNHPRQVIDIWTNKNSGFSNYYDIEMVIPD